MIDKWRSMEHWCNNTGRENYSTRKKIWLSVTYCTTYPTWTGLRLKLGHRCERLTTVLWPMTRPCANSNKYERYILPLSVAWVKMEIVLSFDTFTKFASGHVTSHARRKYFSHLSTRETQVSQKKWRLTLQPNMNLGHLLKLMGTVLYKLRRKSPFLL